ncbi:MAG: hypothetical protein A2138_03820 [Deltaproteobacteria bacterium RBG_16_71_12]|nr:MAG: hypothetical protein A2138_03820 [Deltaproteobacteria bacterium RBG_16_71_12]
MSRRAPLLERVGTGALLRWSAGVGPAASQAVHLLDDGERAMVRRIERGALVRAGLAGALSALAAALADAAVQTHEDSRPLLYWAVVGGVSAVAAVGEIAFLSWDALRSAHALSVAAGVVVDEQREREQTLAVLARAALEMPSPPDSVAGVNPLKEASRWGLLFAGLAYKLKVSASNVIFKQVLRRAFGRAAVRAWLQFVSIPVTAAWNVFTCARVLREMRVRVFGASLAQQVVARLLPAGTPVPVPLAESLLRAVGACVVRSADPHPNLARLLDALERRLAVPRPPDLDDATVFLRDLAALPQAERAIVLRLLRAAVVCDGRVARRERALVVEASGGVGRDVDAALDQERRRVVAGEELLLV